MNDLRDRIAPVGNEAFDFTPATLYGWLEKSPYPAAKLEALKKAGESIITDQSYDALEFVLRHFKTEMFIKDEPYHPDAAKRPRLIIARDPRYRTLFGAFFKPIEN